MRETPVPPSPTDGLAATAIDPIFVSVKDAATVLGLSTKEIYRLLDSKELSGRHYGRRRLVVYASVLAFAAGLLAEDGVPAT